MKQRKRKAARILAVLAVATGTCVIANAPAHAAGCYGVGCNGDDPVALGCSADAITVEEVVLSSGEWIGGATADIQLRYSASCGAAWTRVTASDSTPIVVFNNKGDYSEYTAVANVTSWTNMIDDAASTVHAQACLGTHSNNYHCTAAW